MSFLVCDKCNGYYELQDGESPEDFNLECECGGNLKYTENIETEPSIKSYCPNCQTKNVKNAVYCPECGHKLYEDSSDGSEDKLMEIPDSRKFKNMMSLSGIFTMGLGIILGLFVNNVGGMMTMLLGFSLILIKRVTFVLLIGLFLAFCGLINLSYHIWFGCIQILLSLTFFHSWNKYRKLDVG